MIKFNRIKILAPKSGFTLPEVLVVVLIISILAMTALPSYSGFIEKARCLNLPSSVTSLASCNDVRILVPSDGSTVAMKSIFQGDFSKLSKKLTPWIYVYAPKAQKYYTEIIRELDDPAKKALKSGSWNSEEIEIGRDADKGEMYTVGVLLTEESSTKILRSVGDDLDDLPPGERLRPMQVIRQ